MLLDRAIKFLVEIRGIEKKKAYKDMKDMLDLYKGIDPNDLLPGERRFFPANPKERTPERMLEGFEYIYAILRDASERYELETRFDAFWDECSAYLTKCGYENQSFMANPGIFYRMSFNYWRREFQDQAEGLIAMYNWFKSCFGYEGNEEYCVIEMNRDRTYDWMKMRACYEDLHEPPPPVLIKLPSGPKPELSKESLDKLRAKREEMQVNIAKDNSARIRYWKL